MKHPKRKKHHQVEFKNETSVCATWQSIPVAGISAHTLKERGTTMFGELAKELEKSLYRFLDEGRMIENTLTAWLRDNSIGTSLEQAHRGATEHTCEGMKSSFRAVKEFVEVIMDSENHDPDSLQSIVDRF